MNNIYPMWSYTVPPNQSVRINAPSFTIGGYISGSSEALVEATVPRENAILAWHFLPYSLRLANDDHRLIRPGTISSVNAVKMCSRGLHSSRRLMDAVTHAPSPMLCRVRSWGTVQEGLDKLAATYRECLWVKNVDLIMYQLASEIVRGWIDKVSGISANILELATLRDNHLALLQTGSDVYELETQILALQKRILANETMVSN